jgi:hypothetical protein
MGRSSKAPRYQDIEITAKTGVGGESDDRNYDVRLPPKNLAASAKRGRIKVSPFHAATILVLGAFEGLAGCCCGTVAKRRPIFQPEK